jgi:SAM-dependent methyltransferase
MSGAEGAVEKGVRLLSARREDTFQAAAEWYDCARAEHFWFAWRLAALRALWRRCGLEEGAPLAVFDVGCGAGVLADQVEGCTAWRVDGADLNLPALQRCRPRRGETFYYDITERRAPCREAYDVLLLADILEHIEEPEAFLRAALWHLRPGGWVLLNVPAGPALYSGYDRAAGHRRRYTATGLRAATAPLGLEEVRCRAWGLSLLPVAALRTLWFAVRPPRAEVMRRGLEPPGRLCHRLLHALRRLETALLPLGPCGTSLVLAGRKPPPRGEGPHAGA